MLLVLSAHACFSREELASYSAGAAPDGSSTATPGLTPLTPEGDAGGLESEPELPGAGGAPTSEAPALPMLLDPDVTDAGVVSASVCAGPGEYVTSAPAACYRLIDVESNWSDARAACEAWGGGLAELTTAPENDAATEALEVDVWLGARDVVLEGTMVWNSGAPLDYTDWADAQPDDFRGEDCLEWRQMDRSWNDVDCTLLKLPLCERALADDD
jgi:hypothetical protein